MSIASGYKKFKKYILTSSGFQLVSHWTNANTLQFDDGKTAQAKLGAIDGISSSKDSSSDKIAASTKLVSELNSNLTTVNQNLNGYKFDVIDGIPSYKAGADAVWVPFSNPEVYFAQYSFPANQGTITFTPKKACLWLMTNGDWFSSQYQAQLKLQINDIIVPFASFKKNNNCYIAKYDTKQYINSAASLVVDRTYVVANAYNYIILLGV